MPGEARAPGRPLRLARLLMTPNKLRRRSDRIERAIVILLSAAFVAAAAAAPYFGQRIYQSQRAAAAQLHPAVAVLSQSQRADGGLIMEGRAAARWRAPDGQRRSGTLTTMTAPGIWGAPAGTRVTVWLTRSGQPAAPPRGWVEMMATAVVMAIVAACGAGIVLIMCYWLCRLALDRRRLAGWESAWDLTGPRWTTSR